MPVGWTVDWEFENLSRIPHSAAMVTSTKVPLQLVPFGFGAASTPNALAGTGPGVTNLVSFVADRAGSFILACLVPGHVQSGMWDHFTISSTATAPTIQVVPGASPAP